MHSSYFNKGYFRKFTNKSQFKQRVITEIDRKGPVWRSLKKKFSPGSKLIDIGCGNGVFLKSASKYFNCVGIDFSKDAISLARRNAPNVEYQHGSLEHVHKYPAHSFDVVTCFDVLEHIENHSEFFNTFKSAIKSNGWIIVSIPNTSSVMHRIRGKKWWAYEDKTHISLKSRSEWQSLFESNQFSIIRRWSSGLINHPLPTYSLPKKYLGLHYLTQTLGLLGVSMPSRLSDVDFFALSPRHKT